MSQPRPRLSHHASSERSEGSHPQWQDDDDGGIGGLIPLLAEVTVFVVPGKLDLAKIYGHIDALGGERVLDPDDASLVVTGLRGTPRLERALGPGLHKRTIVTAQYIEDVYSLASKAIDGAVPALPPRDKYLLRFRAPSVEVISPPPSPPDDGPPSKRTRLSSPPPAPSTPLSPTQDAENKPRGERTVDELDEARLIGPRVGKLPDVEPYPTDIELDSIPRMAVLRPSPLECVNQDIIDAIKPIYLEREFDEAQQINTNVLSYRRSMAMLKSVPRRIRSGREAREMIDVGDKVANRIDEYLSTGRIAEAESIRTDARYIALKTFSSVYSIGNATAVQLWNAGCRSLEDVRAYYEFVPPEGRREERKARKRRMEGTMTRAEVVHAWLELKKELDEAIPREEVLGISSVVREHLSALRGDCEQVIAGGYRRGKMDTGDVDVIFTAGPPLQTSSHPSSHRSAPKAMTLDNDPATVISPETGLLFRLVRRLCRLGIVTHVLQLTERQRGVPMTHPGANFDNLDKAFVIMKTPMGRHRRVDLICAPRERYAAAVLSWSGSMMFERDLRRYAEDRGLKFRAGLIDAHTQEELHFATEREIFDYLGLGFVPPELRNADG